MAFEPFPSTLLYDGQEIPRRESHSLKLRLISSSWHSRIHWLYTCANKLCYTYSRTILVVGRGPFKSFYSNWVGAHQSKVQSSLH